MNKLSLVLLSTQIVHKAFVITKNVWLYLGNVSLYDYFILFFLYLKKI